MPKTLTLRRNSAEDLILVPMMVFDPLLGNGTQVTAELDTGNDHTCLRRDVLERIGAKATNRLLTIHGIAGSTDATTAVVTLGLSMDGGGRVTIHKHEVGVVNSLSHEILLGRDMLKFFDVLSTRQGIITIVSD